MAISKVVFGDQTLIDLTSDTIESSKMITGRTAHNAAGESISGSLPWRLMVQNTVVALDRANLNGNTVIFSSGSFNGNTVVL